MTLICELPINSYGKKRNIAMITTQFYTLMRVSELISLNVEDLEISDECITIRIKRSKTDQYGAGRNVVIWKQENVITNPYKYILRWLDELPPHYKGPLFIGKKDIRYTANAYRRAVKVLAKKSAMIQMIIHRIAYEEVVLHIWVYLPYLLGDKNDRRMEFLSVFEVY